MAQLNDLLVLGNTSLIGDVNASGEIVASKLAGDGSSITNINAANISGTLSVAQGGTGKSTWTAYGLIYASATTTLAQISTGTSGYVLQSGGSSNAPSWIQATNANTANTIIKRDASGNFSAGTITANLSGLATAASNARIVVTEPSSGTWYENVFVAGHTEGTNYSFRAHDGFRHYVLQGTTTAVGHSILALGNDKVGVDTFTAGNKKGRLRIYSGNKGYVDIYATDSASNSTHYIPATGGTLLNTGTTSFTRTLTSGTKIGTIKINGTSTDIYCETNTNTDTKVTQEVQTASSYTNWRPLVVGSSNSSTEGFTPATTTDKTYVFNTISVQPSSGTIRATTFKGNVTGTSGGLNSNVSAIELNSGGTLASYGGFIDFHFHNADKKPLNASGTVVSTTPDYTSRIIEDAVGQISINSVKFKNNTVTATTFTGALSGNASSATKFYATNSAAAASTQYFIPFIKDSTSGNKDAYFHSRIYLWDTGSRMHLCVGEQGTSTSDATGAYSGGLTISSGAGKNKYVDIIPEAMTGHRTITIPDANGFMLVEGNYKNIIVNNGLNAPITITNTTATPAAKTDLPILKIKYQNTGGTYYTVDAISAIGTGETGSTINNGCLRMGSTSGCLALTAGECGKNMITKHSLTNTENIYLLTDAGVEFYVGCANDAATSTKALTVTSSGVSPGVDNTITLGTSSLRWKAAYATNFYGSGANLTSLNASNISSGTLAVARGGTGKTTAADACNAFLNALSTGSSTPTDADYFISQYVGGGTTTTTYHRRPVSALWTYMKGKADSIYAPKVHASANTTYGAGSSNNYGHVKLYAATNCDSYTSEDGACTPAAVKKAVETFGNLNGYKVGDTITTARTDLGNKWALCNGAQISTSEAPNLIPLLGGATDLRVDLTSKKTIALPTNVSILTKGRVHFLNNKIFIAQRCTSSDSTPGLQIWSKTLTGTSWTNYAVDTSLVGSGLNVISMQYINGYYIICIPRLKTIGRMYYSSNLTSWNYVEFNFASDDDYAEEAVVSYANGYWFISWGCPDEDGSSYKPSSYLFYSSSIGGTYSKVTINTSSTNCFTWGATVGYLNGKYIVVKNYRHDGKYFNGNGTSGIFYGTSPSTINTFKESQSGIDLHSNDYLCTRVRVINNECIFYNGRKVMIVDQNLNIREISLSNNSASWHNAGVIFNNNSFIIVDNSPAFEKYMGTNLTTATKTYDVSYNNFGENGNFGFSLDVVNESEGKIVVLSNGAGNSSFFQKEYTIVHSTALPTMTHEKVYTYIKIKE